jgi:hypothetical protein
MRNCIRGVVGGMSVSLMMLTAMMSPVAGARELREMKLLYVGDAVTARAAAFADFLRGHAAAVDVAERRTFGPRTADGYDAVLLDWPQGPETRDMRKLAAPLGKREAWGRPTVLLGSAGLNLAVAWQLKGGAGCTCMDPLAYGLREHAVFDGPFKIDRGRMVEILTPEDFRGEIRAAKIRVLPLVDSVGAAWRAGWCTYDYDFAAHPDVEFMSGGVNHKTPTAAGLWRQGNLLHFGFEQSPGEMNETGRNLLLNAVAYISRFSEDRPIARTPSVFAGPAAPSRANLVRRLRNPTWKIEWIGEGVVPELWATLNGKSREELVAWAEAEGKYLHPSGAEARLAIDGDLREMGLTFERAEFLDAVVRLSGGTEDQRARAGRLVERYLPDAKGLDAAGLTAWVGANRAYLFASDTGDYRWYVDPLAKRRGVPSAELRGARRADGTGAKGG